jgi:hypothetical protein
VAPRWDDGMIHGHAVVWPRRGAPGRRHRRAVPLIAAEGLGPVIASGIMLPRPASQADGTDRRRDLRRPAARLHARAYGRDGGHARQPGHGRPDRQPAAMA